MSCSSADAEQNAAELEQAAAAGSADAQFALGDLHQDGRGGCARDLSRAARLFESAAEQGHVAALFALGAAHAKGHGTPQDMRKAAFLLRKAAEAGDAEAQFSLGVMFGRGAGVQANLVEAAWWFRRAAAQPGGAGAKARAPLAQLLAAQRCAGCGASATAGGAALRYHTRSSHARLHAMATSPRIAALISSSSRR